MKVFAASILFVSLLSVKAFAQSTTFQQAGPLAYEHLSNSAARVSFRPGVADYYQPVVVDAPTSQTPVSLTGQFGISSTPPRLSRYFPGYTTPVFRTSLPFTYKSFDSGTSGGVVEAFQIAGSIGLLGFDRPALNQVQNVAVHVMRHYSSQEAMRVNRDCVRSLSCSSLYEKSAVQRIALRPPK